MPGDSPVSWLMFFTLVSGLVIITGAFLFFLRSQRNRDIAANALVGDNARHVGVTANGALPDLIGLGVFAAIAMGLLVAGYSQKSYSETAQKPPMVGGPSAGMAQNPGRAGEPKTYQPANPAPDTRSAPASSPSGIGSDNGGRPEQQPAAK